MAASPEGPAGAAPRESMMADGRAPSMETLDPPERAVAVGETRTSASSGSKASSVVSSTSLRAWLGRRSNVGKLRTEVRMAITFEDLTLLRGSTASQVLQRMGDVLKSNAGDMATYNKSATVEHIDAFISHNWSTPRGKKFRALALCFNFKSAAVLALVLSLGLFALTAAGLLPLLEMRSGASWSEGDYRFGGYATFGGPFLFLLLLFQWQEVGVFLPMVNPIVFLDKTCIHQTDEGRKMQGVRQLAAFIHHSDKMVVVYAATYLQKLWTVYELASFLAIHPRGRLRVLPLFLPDVVAFGMVMVVIVSLSNTVLHHRVVVEALEASGFDGGVLQFLTLCLVVWPIVTMFCAAFRRWLMDLDGIQQHTKRFRVSDAKCFDERDRPVVQRSIHLFMKELGKVSESATEEDALSAFERIVHREVPRALRMSVGRVGILYREVLAIFLGQGLMGLDVCGVGVLQGWPAWRLWANFQKWAMLHLVVFPATMALLSWLLGRSLAWRRGAAVCALLAAAGIVACVVPTAAVILIEVLRAQAYDSLLWFWVYVATFVAALPLVAVLYRPLGPLDRSLPLPHRTTSRPSLT